MKDVKSKLHKICSKQTFNHLLAFIYFCKCIIIFSMEGIHIYPMNYFRN